MKPEVVHSEVRRPKTAWSPSDPQRSNTKYAKKLLKVGEKIYKMRREERRPEC